jgi:hypothetical protein
MDNIFTASLMLSIHVFDETVFNHVSELARLRLVSKKAKELVDQSTVSLLLRDDGRYIVYVDVRGFKVKKCCPIINTVNTYKEKDGVLCKYTKSGHLVCESRFKHGYSVKLPKDGTHYRFNRGGEVVSFTSYYEGKKIGKGKIATYRAWETTSHP